MGLHSAKTSGFYYSLGTDHRIDDIGALVRQYHIRLIMCGADQWNNENKSKLLG